MTPEEAVKEFEAIIKSISLKLIWRAEKKGITLDDLIQTGMVRMLESLPKYRADKGKTMKSYMYKEVFYGLNAYLNNQNVGLYFPREVKDRAYMIFKTNEEMTAEEAADRFGGTVDFAQAAIDYNNYRHPMSWESKVIDLKIDELFGVEAELSSVFVNDFAKNLDERENKILRMKMADQTNRQIAKNLKLSNYQVGHSIRKHIKPKLVEYLEAK